MKRLTRIALALFLGAAAARADFSPEAWHSTALDVVVTTNNNNWYFFPDGADNPRILAKATTSNNTPGRKLLSGGPPAWTSSDSVSMGQINKQGVFVPSPDGGGFFIAPHNTANLKVAIFDSSGASALETIDSNPGTYTGISAELDSTGRLHVGYVADGSYICYARRNAAGSWIFRGENLGSGSVIHETAVVPTTTTDVSLYYCATASNVTSLWRAKPGIVNNTLYVFWAANPLVRLEDFVGKTLRGSRVGEAGRLYYFGSNNSNSWKFKRLVSGGSSTELETAGNVSPASIQVAFGPDGKQRVAWFNETTKSIHYLKPNPVDVPVLAGKPVVLTGTTSDPDLLGLHFGPDGTPYLLYRRDLNEGFVAFPNDNYDFNANGRIDLLDTAFGSPTAGLVMQPVEAAYTGVSNTANRFKFLFPTVGSAISNGQGSLVSSARNLTYGVETSTDGVTWTPVSGFSSIAYHLTGTSGTNPVVGTYLGVLPGEAPGSTAIRLARLKVTRSAYGY